MALAVGTICFHKFLIFSYVLMLMHLVLLARFVVQISTTLSVLVPRMFVFYNNFIAYFLVISLLHSLVSGNQ
jgi:hypothetical protein